MWIALWTDRFQRFQVPDLTSAPRIKLNTRLLLQRSSSLITLVRRTLPFSPELFLKLHGAVERTYSARPLRFETAVNSRIPAPLARQSRDRMR
jgi:hypothetical protein